MATAISMVSKGVAFENRTLRVLQDHLSMSLRRVGGKGDGGIDLQGWWWLPADCLEHLGSRTYADTSEAGAGASASRAAVRVLAQCKAEGKKIGPRFIREFEGTVLRNSADLTTNEGDRSSTQNLRNTVVGLFASTSPFSKASLLQAYSSPIPLALVHLPEFAQEKVGKVGIPCHDHDSVPGQDHSLGALVFNPALSGAKGLLRGMIEPRWERSLAGSGGRPGIWMNGRRLENWVPESRAGDSQSSSVYTQDDNP